MGGWLSNVTVSIPPIHGDFGNGLWNRVYQTLSYTNNKTPANELPPNQASVMRNFRTAETLSCDALGSDRRSTSPTEDSHQVEDSFSIFLGIFRHGPWAVAYDVSMICNPLSHGLGTNIIFTSTKGCLSYIEKLPAATAGDFHAELTRQKTPTSTVFPTIPKACI